MNISQGNLVLVGLNSDAPAVFFNGIPLPGIVEIKVDWEHDERRVKLRIKTLDMETYQALVASGVIVKLGERT